MDNDMNENNRDFSAEYEELIKDMIDKKHEEDKLNSNESNSKTDEEILEEILNEYSNSNKPVDENNDEYIEDTNDVEKIMESRNINKAFLKRSKALLLSALVLGGIGTCAVACNSSQKEDEKNDKNNHVDDDKFNLNDNQKITTAVIDSDGKIQLTGDELDENASEINLDDKESSIIRTVVTAKDVKEVADNYYNYLNEKVEDNSNDINIGALYSTVWLANSQFINVDETNKLIESGLIPNDLTTLKTEVDAIMSIIISENASKVAVSEAFKTELDIDKLISVNSLFIDETDKSVSEYSEQQYLKLISSASIEEEITNIYENTRNFFNNATRYDFSEIKDSKHFRHDYPVNFVQSSIGAQYLIKGIVGPEFVVYTAGTGSITDDESKEFQKTIDDVEGSISYLNDKFNGICFDNETIKTYVK